MNKKKNTKTRPSRPWRTGEEAEIVCQPCSCFNWPTTSPAQ